MKKPLRIALGVVLAWVIFVVGLFALIALDRWLRLADGDIQTGGMPEFVWFGSHLAVSIISLYTLAKVTWREGGRLFRSVFIGVNALVGFCFYLYLMLWYVTGSGIDSL